MHRVPIAKWLRVSMTLLFALSLIGLSQLSTGCKSDVPTDKEKSVTTDGGGGCNTNSDCASGQTCDNGKCVTGKCSSDSDCNDPKKQCKDGSCVAKPGCTDNTDCPPGQTCEAGQCKTGQVGGDPSKIEIVEAGGVLREGQTKQFTARALNKSGATLTGDFQYEWSSSAPDVVSIDKTSGLATGGSKDGEAEITVKLKDLTSTPVKVRNYAKNPAGQARVIVVDDMQKGIAGAKVKVGDKAAVDTDANGVAVIKGVTPPFDIHIFHKDYSYFSAFKVKKDDLYVQLNKNIDNSKAGGVKGKFDFSALQKLLKIPEADWSDYAIGFGIAGLSLSENLLALNFDLIVGEMFNVSLFGKDLNLPSGLVIALASGGKPEFQALGETGRKLLWGFGGKFKLDEIQPIIQGATGGNVDIAKILSSAKPLFKRFAFGYKSDIHVQVYPRVVDSEDKNGNGSKTDMIPDFSKFPDTTLALTQLIDKPISVTLSNIPQPQHNGKPVDLLSIGLAGIILPGIGLVPLGLDVDKVQGTSGKLEVKYAERQGILAKGKFALITLALNISTGDNAPPLMIFGDVKTADTPPTSHTVSSFLPLDDAKYDPATRKLTGATGKGSSLIQIEITDTNGKKWTVVFDSTSAGTITLPAPPAGLDDRATNAKSVSYRPVKLGDGQDMHSILEFNSINMDRLTSVIQGFSNKTIFEKK